VCPPVYDTIYGGPFFGVARWLARLGAHVDIVTPWRIYSDIPPSFSKVQKIRRPKRDDELERFIANGTVDRYDLIVTPDLKITHPLVVQRRLRPETRLAITDFHMLGGMDEWVRDLCPSGRRAEEGGWWPSDQILLYSGFPGYGSLYTRYGVPMRQVAWQPYALDPTSFPERLPVAKGRSIISGGNHRRDLETLLAAAAQLSPNVHPIDLFASVPVPYVPPQIRFGGVVDTPIFCEMVGRSRFMVVPLLPDAHHAAGVTAIVTAIMCGRPIVGTNTAAVCDYVVHGVNGLLVPPSDPPALAAAIEQLDTDPALLAALAAGARATAAKHTTEAWAHALLHGSRTYEADHWMWTKWDRRPATLPR
jgi:glycosyltransferase involved in cell wall biosynthesis